MSKKVCDRRRRVTKANHGARPCTGSKMKRIKGTGKK